jgi:hypothetical protein
MKKILVTPAGRKRYLMVLYSHLLNLRNEFDEWILWVNTENADDIQYMEKLESENDFIKLQMTKIGVRGNETICQFYKDCIDENSVYLKLDDDIVYIEPNSLKKIFDFRIENPQYFLVYGNIVNNGICSHLHQKKELLSNDEFNFGYDCMDETGWNNPKAAEYIHRRFLQLYKENKHTDFYLFNWTLDGYERFSINVVSWLGSEFKKFEGEVIGRDDEQWLSCEKPKEIKKPNIIFGDSLFVHYAFFTQRYYIETTDILKKYYDISKKSKI